MQGIFRKENTDKALKYGIYRHLPTYEKIIRNLVSFYSKSNVIFWSGRVVNGFVYKLPSLLPVVPVTSTYSSKAALNSGCVSKLESGIQGSDTVFDSSVSVSSGTVVSAGVDSTVAGTDSVVAEVSCLPQEAKDKIHTVIKVKIVAFFIKAPICYIFHELMVLYHRMGNNAITFILCGAHVRGTRLYWAVPYRWGGGTGGFGEPGR